jgi:calcium-dependent protein kinase
MRQLLSAVCYCHQHKIVHRDLKPENLLLESDSPDSGIKVIDFGTSRQFEPDEKLRTRLGTVFYSIKIIILAILHCSRSFKKVL